MIRTALEYIWGVSVVALLILGLLYVGTYLGLFASLMGWTGLGLSIIVVIGSLVSYIERRSYVEGFHDAEERTRKNLQP